MAWYWEPPTAPPIAFEFDRDPAGDIVPLRHRLLPAGAWVEEPEQVAAAMAAQRERDLVWVRAWAAARDVLPEGAVQHRLDVAATVVIGLNAALADDYGEAVLAAVLAAASDEVNQGALAFVWAAITEPPPERAPTEPGGPTDG